MNIKVKGFFKLNKNKNYVILDAHNNEVGTLNAIDNPIYASLKTGKDSEEEKVKEFNSSEEVERWFVDNNYTLTTDSVRWVEYNPNPNSNNTGDCSIRAYCAAENIEWDKAYDIACKYGKVFSLMPNDKKTCKNILEEEFGYEYHKMQKDERGKTVNQVAIDFPVGTYILDCGKHFVTIIDGEYYDSWDSGKKKVRGYFYKTSVDM